MKITKYGHACLLVEEGEARILIDPGTWNETPDAEHVDAILITHEHQDHIDIPQLKEVLSRSPKANVITHEGLHKLLSGAGILYLPIEDGGSIDVKGVTVTSVGTNHAIIYGDVSPCRNTGYLIADRLFVPGDALHDVPKVQVEILALPTGGPWMKLAEAIEYAKALKPKVAFSIHDAMYSEEYRTGLVPRLIETNLEPFGIAFRDMQNGVVEEF
jgi:L-ascorbate metabolism protein UlaG (beta-lactamase superfamily)